MYNLPSINCDKDLISYLDQVHKFPYLSKEEEYKYAKKWVESKDVSAAHKLVTSHLRLVTKIASNFKGYGLNMLDVISEGNIGLMHAVKKFNPDNGARLCTYAMWWISSYIHDYVLKSWSLVKIGTTAAQKKLFFNLRKLKNKITKFHDSTLTDKEINYISNELDVTDDEVLEMDLRMTARDKSLNDIVRNSDNESSEFIDFIPGANSHESYILENDEYSHRKNLFYEAYSNLNEREKDIINSRKLKDNPETLEELSQKYNLSRERIRQIEIKAMQKIKELISCKI